ncbi:hypothetical protein Q8A67_018180 [Cirrhinus molitorella]|uniref:Uncharacterized protein n=1 Tax=Cirrhinus molitorella TaxID=172907 RepID=A0AA88PFW7_9TELE|nr:hypothetical protein Q8A67_018180 [Cirrhinus molitorella]
MDARIKCRLNVTEELDAAVSTLPKREHIPSPPPSQSQTVSPSSLLSSISHDRLAVPQTPSRDSRCLVHITGHSNGHAPNRLKTKLSVAYMEVRLVGNYIQMWQTSERRTPPPLLPLPPLFGTLNEISPICGGNSVAHPSQNMSDVIPLTSPGSSPNILPPPTPLAPVLPCPRGNGPRREKIRFGGEEERSRVLNQTQTGLRRGRGADWKAQVIPAPAFAAIGLWEASITLSRSGRRLQRMSEATASLQAQSKWPVAEK